MKTKKCFSGGPISWRPRPTSDRTFPRITICKLRIYYSKIEEAQRVCVLVAAELLLSRRHSGRVRGGESPEGKLQAGGGNGRERTTAGSRVGHSGTLRAELGEGYVHRPVSAPWRRVHRGGAEFRRVCPGGKLET